MYTVLYDTSTHPLGADKYGVPSVGHFDKNLPSTSQSLILLEPGVVDNKEQLNLIR